MHIKTKSLFIFYLSIFVSFSVFGGIAESFCKWRDDFLNDQANKFKQAMDESDEEMKEASTWVYMNENNLRQKVGIEIRPKNSIGFIKINSIHKALLCLAVRTLTICYNFHKGIRSLLDQNEFAFPSSGVSKNVLIATTISLLVGLSKSRFKPALVTFLLSSALGFSLLTEGQIRSYINVLDSIYLKYSERRDLNSYILFEKKLKMFYEFLGCEINLKIDSDDRSYTTMPSKLLRVLVDNAEAHQKSIFLRVLNKINPFSKDVSKEYVELENILKHTLDDTLVKVPKYLLPYLLDHLYEICSEGLYYVGNVQPIRTMDTVIRCHRFFPNRIGEDFYRPLELLDILDLIPCIDIYEYMRDEDGTPRIYQKDCEGNLIQDDRIMKLCGLHGISYSSIKEKRVQEGNSYSSILKEQRTQEAAA